MALLAIKRTTRYNIIDVLTVYMLTTKESLSSRYLSTLRIFAVIFYLVWHYRPCAWKMNGLVLYNTKPDPSSSMRRGSNARL